jgi:hypothetical protein
VVPEAVPLNDAEAVPVAGSKTDAVALAEKLKLAVPVAGSNAEPVAEAENVKVPDPDPNSGGSSYACPR